MDYFEQSLNLHRSLKGKIRVSAKMDVRSKEDLSLVYSPGVAAPCRAIAADPEDVYNTPSRVIPLPSSLTGRRCWGLVTSGASASIPVMEGKAMLFKRFANIDAFPICLDTQDTDKIVETVRLIAPVFRGGEPGGYIRTPQFRDRTAITGFGHPGLSTTINTVRPSSP